MKCKIYGMWTLDSENLMKYGTETSFDYTLYGGTYGWAGLIRIWPYYDGLTPPPLPDWINQIKVDMSAKNR